MFTRLTNFGTGGANRDQFEAQLQGNQWSRMDNVDINNDYLESAGADVPRGNAAPVAPAYIYLYEAGPYIFDVISDGTEVWARSQTAEWSRIIAGLTGGAVTFTVFRGCLVINSASDGLFYWCQVYGDPFSDTWGDGFPGSWDDDYDIPWDAASSELGTADTWVDGPDTSWAGGDALPWSGDLITAASSYVGWPGGWRAQRVVAYRDQLVAVNVSGSDLGEKAGPFIVRWSSLAAAGGLPNSWEPAVGNFAGYATVQDTPGALVTGEVLRDSLMLYKTDGSIWRLTATGDPTLPMLLERVMTDEGGIEYVRNVCVAGDVHFLLSKRGFGVFDGNGFTYLDFLKVQSAILSTISSNVYEFLSVSYYGPRKEVWIGFSGPDTTYLAGIMKYSLQHQAFSIHDYSSQNLVSIACGREVEPDDVPAEGDPLATTEVCVMGFTTTLATYRHGITPTYIDDSPKTCSLQRFGFRFYEGDKSIVRALYPEMMKGDVDIELGWGWAPNIEDSGSTTWEPARTFEPGPQRKIPYRVIGDAFAVRMTTQNTFVLAALTFEHYPSARR